MYFDLDASDGLVELTERLVKSSQLVHDLENGPEDVLVIAAKLRRATDEKDAITEQLIRKLT